MPRVGVCKDRLADAIERFGRIPIVKRTLYVDRDDVVFTREGKAPYWAAAGLIHDGRARIVLVRVRPPAPRWGDAWVTPGGRLGEGETVVEGLRRETREEVGLELDDFRLMRILNETVTDGARVRHGYFAQFVARAVSTEIRPGREILEAQWFDELPDRMAYREDYADDFRRLRDQKL